MNLKEYLRSILTRHAESVYRAKLKEKSETFDSWIRTVEDGLERFDMTLDTATLPYKREKASYVTHYDGMTVRIFPYSLVGDNFIVKNLIEDIIVFVNGELTDRAIPLIVKCFKAYPSCSVVYGDEDIAVLDEQETDRYGKSVYGTRENPYFKPDWSPNTFLNNYYFCNICAIRRVSFRDIEFGEGRSGADGIYHTLLRFLYEDEGRIYKSVRHIDEILVHATDYEYNDLKDERACSLASGLKTEEWGEGLNVEEPKTVTVVIPSKDNPTLLENCLTTLYDSCPGSIVLEVVVVDNGSSLANKERIEGLREKFGFIYEYTPMEFNFARMCNIGAGLGSGEYILFLNDDVSFTEPYTLENMLMQASFTFTGAVGAKLLYPGIKKIQHAGVVNNRIGPVHKLQFADDNRSYYYGFNRSVRNVLAVTGACLMVRRKVFENVGGMNESLRVAFNDVDLCFKLSESGYFNVCCNNISLEHAESVSRGKDTDTASLARLIKEKKMLYEEHPAYKNYDPFYSKYLVSDCLDTRITHAGEYDYGLVSEDAGNIALTDLSKAREDACVLLNVEYADTLSDYTFYDDDEGFYVQGFSFVTGSNNACYKKALLLKNDEKCYMVSFTGCIRNDVAINCADQSNVELSGFAVRLSKDAIPAGRYTVGVMHDHMFAKEKLYAFSNRELTVK